MKSIFAIMVFSCFAWSCQTITRDTQKKSTKKEQVLPNAKCSLNVTGMTCQMGCANFIRGKINETEGISNTYVDFEKGLVTVYYDSTQTNPNQILTLFPMMEGKYKATLVK